MRLPGLLLTFFGHANLKAFLQTTVLAAVACYFVDLTVLVSVAGVNHIFLNTAPEETLEVTNGKGFDTVFSTKRGFAFGNLFLSHADCRASLPCSM